MKIDLRNNQDFFAGLLFTVIGLLAIFLARDYPFGSAMRMGPGYFPIVLGGIMAALGLYVLLRGLIKGTKIEGGWAIKPLVLIVLGVVAFGFIMERLGMVPALITMFFISTLGGHEFKFKEVLILSVAMTVLAWGIFIYGLGLNFRLFWWS